MLFAASPSIEISAKHGQPLQQTRRFKAAAFLCRCSFVWNNLGKRNSSVSQTYGFPSLCQRKVRSDSSSKLGDTNDDRLGSLLNEINFLFPSPFKPHIPHSRAADVEFVYLARCVASYPDDVAGRGEVVFVERLQGKFQ